MSSCAAVEERNLGMLRAVFEQHGCVERVAIFGSRARGPARRASDLDMAVWTSDADSVTWARLVHDVEESDVIYSMDLVRMATLSNHLLRRAIERDGMVIYERGTPRPGALS